MTTPRRTLLLLGAAMSFAALIGGYVAWLQSRPPVGPAALPSATLSQIRLPDIRQTVQEGDQWLGQVVVVNHWASWCPPCRKEIPLLIDAQQRYRADGVQIVGIAHDPLEAARATSASMGINYPSLVAITGGGELMAAQGSSHSGLPFTAFFDRHGRLVANHLGDISAAELDQRITELLALP